MGKLFSNVQFLLLGAANFCLFLVLSSWSFIPLFIVQRGGDRADAGLVMGSIGLTSLGCLPFITPLIERYGRKVFIVSGVLLTGVSNGGFLLFDSYSLLMIVIRLVQGVAFAACFTGCATAVVDLVPPRHRAQGIGLFGVSGSLAVAVGPWVSEWVMLSWGFEAYFVLLIAFGVAGCFIGLFIKESAGNVSSEKVRGFFPTAVRDRHLPMMATAAVFGSGFAAMNAFFPLYAVTLGLRSGAFFACYGFTLVLVRVVLGSAADRMEKEKLTLACLVGFALMLLLTAGMAHQWQALGLGVLFGLLQGLSYPAMMARMVDRSREGNRAIVVGLFTGSFGVGINASVILWGLIADLRGLSSMYVAGAGAMLIASLFLGAGLLSSEKRRQRVAACRGET